MRINVLFCEVKQTTIKIRLFENGICIETVFFPFFFQNYYSMLYVIKKREKTHRLNTYHNYEQLWNTVFCFVVFLIV